MRDEVYTKPKSRSTLLAHGKILTRTLVQEATEVSSFANLLAAVEGCKGKHGELRGKRGKKGIKRWCERESAKEEAETRESSDMHGHAASLADLPVFCSSLEALEDQKHVANRSSVPRCMHKSVFSTRRKKVLTLAGTLFWVGPHPSPLKSTDRSGKTPGPAPAPSEAITSTRSIGEVKRCDEGCEKLGEMSFW